MPDISSTNFIKQMYGKILENDKTIEKFTEIFTKAR